MRKHPGHVRKHLGFTLVELVVVVMILGILAAVAAPKLLSTSGTATDNGLKQTLGVVRDAIERYAAEHGGALPGADANPGTFVTDLVPDYLRGSAFPDCPLPNKDNAVIMVPNEASLIPGAPVTSGWVYDYGTGGFIINSTAQTESDSDGTTTYDQL